jgi:hypothetical protein
VNSPSLSDLIIQWITSHQTILTILVAGYGAVVATAVGVWNIYRSVTDRGRLKVAVTRGNAFAAGVGRTFKEKLWYQVTNVGRQPIWLTQVGGGYRNGEHFSIDMPAGLPMKLEPGEVFKDASCELEKLDPPNVAFLGAWDSLDKIHKLPKRKLKALLKDAKGG